MLSRKFWSYIDRYRRAYLWGYAAVLASIVMTQLAPWALKLGIDGVRQGAPQGRLLAYAAALVLIALREGAFHYAMRLSIPGAALRIEPELRRDYFAPLPSMPLDFVSLAR